MTTEIRAYGDGKQVVAYTDEQAVLSRLREWRRCLRIVWYEQADAMVAADLYFEKAQEESLCCALGISFKPHQKRTVTQSAAFLEARKQTQFRKGALGALAR